MKTLIVYGTKTGVTEECAKELSELIKGEKTLVNVKNAIVDVNSFDRIIIGTSIYAGMINGKVKKFYSKYKDVLLSKKLYIFTCGLSDNNEALTAVEKSLGPDIKSHATISHFGGDVRPNDAKGFLKLIVKAMAKNVKSSLDKNNIKEFAIKINK
jgi:menaquinone-dependent protoporphyrinogen oxidase